MGVTFSNIYIMCFNHIHIPNPVLSPSVSLIPLSILNHSSFYFHALFTLNTQPSEFD